MASWKREGAEFSYGYNGVNGAGIGEVSLYLHFVSGT